MDRQRIDKWLWHARAVRTRTAAAALADQGCVRVNGARITAASKLVRAGDVLTLALDRVRILKVVGFCERRGSARDAAALYEDLTPVPAAAAKGADAAPPAFQRAAGAGRPTKRERRALEKLTDYNDR
ncbi:MAG: RNA-binding S4 domain-containing protein [Pseudorhodoplanes sp.]|nr:RNA-binding S4 domain-containing protein [Pseudorhodoplanes sp.]MCL4713012.1 RNA-binding S4 domain-containing protein [Pseudorhodoplanes sp.]MCQ3944126.1 RNA-binding S4 domain-containing protein [Alphaproteobacteria bacterium]